MSSSSFRHSFGGMGYRSKRDFTDNNLFSENSNSRPYFAMDPPELNNSKVDFLEKQTCSKEKSYKSLFHASIALNLITIAFTVAIIGVWFYWLTKINSDSFRCGNLKRTIIWGIVVYLVGILSQILGMIVGWIRSAFGLLIYQAIIVILFVLRIGLDIETTNNSIQFLEGCTSTKATVSLNYYIYASILYCISLMVLFTCNLNLVSALRNIRKAMRVQQEFLIKNERFV